MGITISVKINYAITFIRQIIILKVMGGGNIIEGTVISGLGEGSYFMSMDYYKKEIKDKLGFDAYPGTLNIRTNKNQLNILNNPIKINGFENKGKKFRGVRCFKSKIKNVEGAILIPDINKHKKNIIEFISKKHIKSELNVKNGDKVTIELI